MNPISNLRNILLHIVFFVSLIFVCGYVYVQNANYYTALAATKEWARLNEFPANASKISVKTTGNMFSREFIVTFVAPMDEIDNWLNRSPGTKDVTPIVSGTVREYQIEPGGGARRAELKVDEQTGKVTIKTFWS